MKVTVNNFALANHGVESVSGFRIDGSGEVQEVAFPDAEELTFFDRANERTAVSFNSIRTFDTPADAETFILEHQTACPKQGLVEFESEKPNKVVTRRYLADAMVRTVSSSYHGCTTFHSYQISGGKMLAKKPAAT